MSAPDAPIATAEDMAALDYEAWSEQGASPAVAREWLSAIKSHFTTVMMAAVILRKSKLELEDCVREMSQGAGEQISGDLAAAHDTFEAVRAVLSCAETRMMAAYASVLKQADPEGFGEA